MKIKSEDPFAFSRFAQEHPICFQEKDNWLFSMMFDFYTNEIHSEISYLSFKNLDYTFIFHFNGVPKPSSLDYIDMYRKYKGDMVYNHKH